MLDAAVARTLRVHREKHLAKLFELLRFDSIANVTAEPDPCVQCACWLVEHLTALGLHAQIVPTGGKPCVLAEGAAREPDAPTLLIYGHYDVQPPEPLDLWTTVPFEPVVRDGAVWARGANDDKGQLFAHLMAIDAWEQTGGLPVHVKLLLEGEEEIGSPHMEAFLDAHADRLAADAAVISDSEFFARGVPSITYGLRGLAYFEVRLSGPDADLHSGSHGGAVTNPIHGLTRLLAGLHDDAGRVTLPGFYDDVRDLTAAQRDAWASLPFEEDAYAAGLGVGALGGGENGYTVLERRWARPTLDANGIHGGYTAPGSKTIIPAETFAKVSMRLVADQDPEKIVAAFRRYVDENTPPGLRSRVEVFATARPVLLATDSPAMMAAREAIAEAFEAPATLVRCGASVPVTEIIQRRLGLDAVMMGLGLPDDNLHAPDEHFRLDQLHRGSIAAAAFYQKLGEHWTGGSRGAR